MRQIVIATALVVAIVAIWGASVITAHSPKTATATPASTLIDVMRMMKDAKNLPDESFDAH